MPTRCSRAAARCLITADHGNIEQLIDPETGGPHTAHTTNPVPLWWVGADAARQAPARRRSRRPGAPPCASSSTCRSPRDDRAQPARRRALSPVAARARARLGAARAGGAQRLPGMRRAARAGEPRAVRALRRRRAQAPAAARGAHRDRLRGHRARARAPLQVRRPPRRARGAGGLARRARAASSPSTRSCPVPRHLARVRSESRDPVHELARGLARALGAPRPRRVLWRARATPPQTGPHRSPRGARTWPAASPRDRSRWRAGGCSCSTTWRPPARPWSRRPGRCGAKAARSGSPWPRSPARPASVL